MEELNKLSRREWTVDAVSLIAENELELWTETSDFVIRKRLIGNQIDRRCASKEFPWRHRVYHRCSTTKWLDFWSTKCIEICQSQLSEKQKTESWKTLIVSC